MNQEGEQDIAMGWVCTVPSIGWVRCVGVGCPLLVAAAAFG